MEFRCRVGALSQRVVRVQVDEVRSGSVWAIGGEYDEFGLDVECVGLLCQDVRA